MKAIKVGFGSYMQPLREEANVIDNAMEGKSVEQYIEVALDMADLGLDITEEIIGRIADENKLGVLIKRLEDNGLEIPEAIAHIISQGGIGTGMDDGWVDEDGEVEPESVGIDPNY